MSVSRDAIDSPHRVVDGGRARAFVDEAVPEKLDGGAFGALLAQMLEETGGPLTEGETAETDARLG